MKNLFVFLFLILATTSYAQHGDYNSKPVREDREWLDVWLPNTNDTILPRVLLIGNSITRAYNREVEQELKGKAYVSRLATSKSVGDPGLLAEIELVMKYHKFDVVHFNNGMHGFGYTEEQYAQAFPDFYEVIKRNAPDAILIWATTTPVRCGEGMKDFESRTSRIRERNSSAAQYFVDKDVITNDLFGFVEPHPEFYAGGDGVHLVPAGVSAMAVRVAEVIANELEKRK